MKKSFITFLATAIVCLLMVSCASAPKEKRALKWDAEKITDEKKAALLAENFGMTVLQDKVFETGSIFIARNDLDEKVVYYVITTPEITNIYSYVETDGKATSFYQQQNDEITFMMKNTDKEMKYDAPGYYIKSSDVQVFTKMCCMFREAMRLSVIQEYKVDLWDVLEVKASDF